MTWLLRIWILLATLLLLGADLPPLGLPAVQSLQGWWTARRFEQADADLDLLVLPTLGEDYLQRTGNGEALEFALYQVGFASASPSSQRTAADALDLALQGADWADRALHQLPKPWSALETQAHTLVQRAFPLSAEPDHLQKGLAAIERWLAAGGGPELESELPRDAYRQFLATSRPHRPTFLLNHLAPASSGAH